MPDYKTIITQYYALHMTGCEIAGNPGVSKSGVNDFLNAFKACVTLSYPLPNGITNYGIYEQVYGSEWSRSYMDSLCNSPARNTSLHQ